MKTIKFKRYFKNDKTGEITYMIWGCVNYKYESVTDFSGFVSPGTNNMAYPIADVQFNEHDNNYEGDIVDIKWLTPSTGGYFQFDDAYCENSLRAVVTFNQRAFAYKGMNEKYVNFPKEAKIEVIGNVFENPDIMNP